MPAPHRRPGAMFAGVLTAACLVGTLASCSPRETGAAALVDDRAISVSDVQDATGDIWELDPSLRQSVTQDQVLLFLILGPGIVDAASEAGIGVSTESALAALEAVEEPSDAGALAWQAQLAFGRAGQELDPTAQQAFLQAVSESVTDADIEINPRYGVWDDQLAVTPTGPEWLQSASGESPLVPAAPADPAAGGQPQGEQPQQPPPEGGGAVTP